MKTEMITRVKQIFEDGNNITEYLRNAENRDYNTVEDIMISYDFQAGTYNEDYLSNRSKYENYHCEIAEYINKYVSKLLKTGCDEYSILEAGIGEGTTFCPIMNKLEIMPTWGGGWIFLGQE